MDKRLYIKELARLGGVNTNTIRYYESMGLLLPAERNESGYRLYSALDFERLAFIQQAKAMGFALAEIKEILAHSDAEMPLRDRVISVLDKKIADVDRRVQELHALRAELSALRDGLRPGGDPGSDTYGAFIDSLKLSQTQTGQSC